MSSNPPARAEALVQEGNQLFGKGDLEGARARYEAAVELQPDYSRAHCNLAITLERLGRADAALTHYERAVAADPRNCAALVNWGNALNARGETEAAERLYRRALEVDPNDGHALNNLGAIAIDRGDDAEAETLFLRAVAAGRGEAHLPLAHLLDGSGRTEEAIRHYARAAEVAPASSRPLARWAGALLKLGDNAQAEAIYRRALAIDPDEFEALNNVAKLTLDRGNAAEARTLFERASALKPDIVEPRYNLALLELQQHRFAPGWEGYELRFDADARTIGRATSRLPRWDGGGLPEGARVAVGTEQGIGDQILFSTLLPELAARGTRAVVEIDARLLEIYRRSVAGVDFVAAPAGPEALRGCAAEIPIGSLPRLLRPSLASFASQPRALLRADRARAGALRASWGESPRVAISWRSFQKGRHRALAERKSAALERFAVFEGTGVHLVDLQYGDAADERAHFDARHPGLRTQVPGLDLFNDIEGVIAAIAACDLVITTSNVTAHFAGAIGKRTWLLYLAGNPPFHYWAPGADRRCLWYPSVEVVTAAEWTRWEDAFAAAARRWQDEQERV